MSRKYVAWHFDNYRLRDGRPIPRIDANFSGAKLDKVNFQGAKLTGVDLTRTTIRRASPNPNHTAARRIYTP